MLVRAQGQATYCPVIGQWDIGLRPPIPLIMEREDICTKVNRIGQRSVSKFKRPKIGDIYQIAIALKQNKSIQDNIDVW